MNGTPWFESHSDLPDHPKTIATAAALRIDKDMLVGKLNRLWNWMLPRRRDGFIAYVEAETVAEIMRWRESPQLLFDALCIAPQGHAHGFLYQVDGGYMLNDWQDYTYRYYQGIDKKESDRQRYERKTASARDNHNGNHAEEIDNNDSCANNVTLQPQETKMEPERISREFHVESARSSREFRPTNLTVPYRT